MEIFWLSARKDLRSIVITQHRTNKSRLGRVEGTSFQIWTSQFRAAHAGTLHNSFCCVRCIKISANLEASLTVLCPMDCLFHRSMRRKAAAPSTSPSSGNSQAILFLPLQKWVTTAAGCTRRSLPSISTLKICIQRNGAGWSNMALTNGPTSCGGHCCTNCCASQCFCWGGLSSRNKRRRRELIETPCCMVPLLQKFRRWLT